MISVKNIFHDYSGKGEYAVNDVSFTINDGEIFGFLGPSGAGKSTVQNIITGLLKLQKGEIFYDNVSVRDIRPKFFNKIGVSFEHPNLYNKLSGYENLKYFAGLFSVKTEDPLKLLELVGLKDSAHKKAASYSKGMKQSLVFARSIINNPKILFLDEPTSGLDPNTSSVIKNIIRDQKNKGATIFLTTHNMYVADDLCDRVAFINDGKLVAIDSPRNLKLKYGEKSVKVEYNENGNIASQIFSLNKESDKKAMYELINTKEVQTVHTQEATLEQIFITLTGRGL